MTVRGKGRALGAVVGGVSLVAAVAGMSPVSSASERHSSGSKTTLTVLMEQASSPAEVKAQAAFFNQITSQFEKEYPSISVKLSTYTGSASSQVDPMVASHTGPNVLEIGTTFMPTIAASGAFVSWTKAMLKQIDVSNLFLSAMKMAGLPGKAPVAIPDSSQPFALFYNKSMFAKAGIASPPTTWNQFVADAKRLTDPRTGVYGAVIPPSDNYYNNHITWLLARQNGGELINSSGTAALFASKPVNQVLQFYVDWMSKFHIVAPSDAEFTEADAVSNFLDGKAAMFPVGGLYDMGQIDATASPSFIAKVLGVAPNPVIPYGDTKTPRYGLPTPSFVSGQEQTIFKYSTSPAQERAAVDWIGFYTSPTVQERLPKLFGTLPINKNAFSASYLKTPLWQTFATIEKESAPTPLVAGWLDLASVWAPALAKVFDAIPLHTYEPGLLATTEQSADSQIDSTLTSLGS